MNRPETDAARVQADAPNPPDEMQATPAPSQGGDGDLARPEAGVVVVPSIATRPSPADRSSERPPPRPELQAVQVNRQVLDLVTGRTAEAEPARAAEAQRDLNHIVHQVLIVGLVLSVVLLLTGVGLDLFRQRELPAVIPSPLEAFRRVLALRPSGFLALGLTVLVATPIVRVIGSFLVFLYERDWRYAAITAVVLVITIISIRTGAG